MGACEALESKLWTNNMLIIRWLLHADVCMIDYSHLRLLCRASDISSVIRISRKLPIVDYHHCPHERYMYFRMQVYLKAKQQIADAKWVNCNWGAFFRIKKLVFCYIMNQRWISVYLIIRGPHMAHAASNNPSKYEVRGSDEKYECMGRVNAATYHKQRTASIGQSYIECPWNKWSEYRERHNSLIYKYLWAGLFLLALE